MEAYPEGAVLRVRLLHAALLAASEGTSRGICLRQVYQCRSPSWQPGWPGGPGAGLARHPQMPAQRVLRPTRISWRVVGDVASQVRAELYVPDLGVRKGGVLAPGWCCEGEIGEQGARRPLRSGRGRSAASPAERPPGSAARLRLRLCEHSRVGRIKVEYRECGIGGVEEAA